MLIFVKWIKFKLLKAKHLSYGITATPTIQTREPTPRDFWWTRSSYSACRRFRYIANVLTLMQSRERCSVVRRSLQNPANIRTDPLFKSVNTKSLWIMKYWILSSKCKVLKLSYTLGYLDKLVDWLKGRIAFGQYLNRKF